MKFIVCLAALVAVACAEPGYGYGVAPYGAAYGHGYRSGYGYGYAPVVKAIAPVATSYANVNSVHLGGYVARPAYAPVAYAGHGLYGAHGVYGAGLGYSSGVYNRHGHGYRSYAHHY